MSAGARWAVGGIVAGLLLVGGLLLGVVGVLAAAGGAWFDQVAFADDHEGVVLAVSEEPSTGLDLVEVRFTDGDVQREETGEWMSTSPLPEVGDAVAVHDGPAVDRPTVRPPLGITDAAVGTRNAGIGMVVGGVVAVLVAVGVLVLTGLWARRAPRRPVAPPYPGQYGPSR